MEDQRGHFWIYVWLGISGVLNATGMASIIDGFVLWSQFFQNIIDVYRATIRAPLAYVGSLMWPFGTVPGWVLDVFVIWTAFVIANNIRMYVDQKKTIPGIIASNFKESRAHGCLALVTIIILTPFLPLLVVYSIFSRMEGAKMFAIRVFSNLFYIIVVFILFLFINWQLKQHGF